MFLRNSVIPKAKYLVADLIDHHKWEDDEEWTRYEGDTNIHRWGSIKDKMAHGSNISLAYFFYVRMSIWINVHFFLEQTANSPDSL